MLHKGAMAETLKRNLTITTNVHLDKSNVDYLTLSHAVERMSSVVNIDKITFEPISVGSTILELLIKLVDGRIWKDKIDFINPLDVSHSFDIPGYWKESEFILNREIRASLIKLHNIYGVNLLKITWEIL